MSFIHFCKKNLACIKLGIASRIAYPLDFCMAIAVLPLCNFIVEVAFWSGLIYSTGSSTFAGYSVSNYIAYYLWLILKLGSINWRFEKLMISEINSGAVNSLLLRPSSFYEYHLGQILGQKLLVVVIMTPVVFLIASVWELPFYPDRFLAALLMSFLYVIMIYTLHFAVSSMAFFLDNVYSLNNTKTMIIWILSGEVMPLDLLPSNVREIVIALPFSCGNYLPAAYVSGRITTAVFINGFYSLAAGFVLFGIMARVIWQKGLRRYGGTGT